MEENKKSKKKIIPLIITAVVAVIIILGLGFLIGNFGGGDNKVPTMSEKEDLVTVKQRSLLMKSGETRALTVKGKDVKYASNNEAVAKVDASGKVTAVAKGNALITITSGDETEYCGVIVDAVGTMIDVTKQSAKKLVSDVELEEPREISGFAIDTVNNVYYFAQPYGTTSYENLASDVIVNKVQKNNKGVFALDSWMRFYESGTGRIAIDKEGTETQLLLESNGTYYGSGSTLSIVKWENEGFGQEEYGITYELDGIAGSASPTLDKANNLLMVYDNSSKEYLFYNYEDVVNGETTYLHKVKCANEQQPVTGDDESQGFYNASIRGFALANGYIYQISGSSSIYISVFDMEGTLQYCYRVPDYSDMEVRMPGGIVVENGNVYIAVGSYNTGYYFANVWMFK